MSDRDDLVERITKDVLARLAGAGKAAEKPGKGAEKPDEAAEPETPRPAAPTREHGTIREAEAYPKAEHAPPDLGRASFRHPSPVDADDRARAHEPSRRAPETVRSFVAAGASRIGNGPGGKAVPRDIAKFIDHTLLKPDATESEIRTLCEEARLYGFASVCINPGFVKLAAPLLRGTDVRVCTVVGFPLGATTPQVKAIREGAREVDMVIHVGALKSGNYDLVEQDIVEVVEACREAGVLCKVIIEAALLSDEEKVVACLLAKRAGADFVKTSTGFASGGATLRDVAIMRATVGPEMGVKAAGGIRSYLDAVGMIEAGATRIGASAGVRIVAEAERSVRGETPLSSGGASEGSGKKDKY